MEYTPTKLQSTQAIDCLLAISPDDFEQFFELKPDDLSQSLGISVAKLKEKPKDQNVWLKLLQEHNPSAIITGWGSPGLPENYLEYCPNLRYVCHLCGEVSRLVSRKMIDQGLLVSNWGPSISPIVAECVLLLMLASLRQLTKFDRLLHTPDGWREPTIEPRSLRDRTVGIHGFGNIASKLTHLLEPFNTKITSFCPGVPDQILQDHNVTRVNNLDTLFENSDIVVELEALTKKSQGMVTKQQFRKMKTGGIFVNVGRGKVVNQDDLIEAAMTQDITVALDVYEEEPLPSDSPLRNLPNAILLPHIGGPTLDRRKNCGNIATENLMKFFSGKPIENLITPQVFDRIT
ncbi:hydroxyacid dehydrogenase [Puniceicoccaceae bacterium K14]|nr:hydroxyacid dehydrogenase [Puniceicoccaceae bacterium K14]